MSDGVIVDPVTCLGGCESLETLYTPHIGKKQSQLSLVVTKCKEGKPNVNSSKNTCSTLYEQGRDEQLQQETDFDSFQAFDKVNPYLNHCLNILHSWVQILGLCLLLHYKHTLVHQCTILHLMTLFCFTKGYVNHVFPIIWESGFQ